MEKEQILTVSWISGSVLSIVVPPILVSIFLSGGDYDDDENNGGSGDEAWYEGPDGLQALVTSGAAYLMTMLIFIALSVYGSIVLMREKKLLLQAKEGVYEASDVYNDGEYYLSSDEHTIIVEKKKNYLKIGILRGATMIFGAYSFIVAVLLAVGGGGPPGEWLNIDASTLVAVQFFVWVLHSILFSVLLKNYSKAKEIEDLLPARVDNPASYKSPEVVKTSPNEDEIAPKDENPPDDTENPSEKIEDSPNDGADSPQGESTVPTEDHESSDKTKPLV